MLLCALLVAGSCTWIFTRNTSAHAAGHVPERHCLAAAKDLQPGEVLQPQDLAMVSWPASLAMSGTFDKGDVLIGRAVLYPVEKGQPITEKLLSSPGAGVGLAGEIASGMRAIALRSDEVMGVAGFLFPGSRVDVLVTYRTDKSPESQTLTVLQNVEVLAAGQKTQPDPEGKAVTATVVTLLLTPEDAQKAVLASTQGTVHFVLRNGTDKEQTHAPPVALSQLYVQQKQESDPVGAVRQVTPTIHRQRPAIVVDTISGGKVVSQTFGGPQ